MRGGVRNDLSYPPKRSLSYHLKEATSAGRTESGTGPWKEPHPHTPLAMQVHSAGPADPPMEMTFRKLWSLKEAYTKARGDGLGFPFKRCEFTLGGTHPAAPARAAHTAGGAPPAVVETAAVAVDGEPRPEWKFYIQPLREDHWVSVARGPPTDAVDAHGGFVSTFRKPRLQPEELARGHAAAEPPFVNKRVEELVPPAVAERLAAARTGAT